MALTPVISKCLEELVRTRIIQGFPATFDPHQFAYRKNRSTEDAIAIALHTTLTHLEQKDSYIRLLFIDFSSAFNTIVPARLVTKLHDLGLPHSTRLWIKDYLSDRSQRVKVGPHRSSALSLNTGVCAESPAIHSIHSRLHPHPPVKHYF